MKVTDSQNFCNIIAFPFQENWFKKYLGKSLQFSSLPWLRLSKKQEVLGKDQKK